MEGDKTAKRQRIAGRAFPDTYGKEKPWREQTPPKSTRCFRHPGTIRCCCSRPLLRRGRRALGIKERTFRYQRHPVDDTASLSEPLHGREGWHATFPGHTKPPNEAKEASIMQTKQPKHKKAKDENEIAQAESYMAKTQRQSYEHPN